MKRRVVVAVILAALAVVIGSTLWPGASSDAEPASGAGRPGRADEASTSEARTNLDEPVPSRDERRAATEPASPSSSTPAAAPEAPPEEPFPGEIVLEVTDALTGAPLGDVWVQVPFKVRRDSDRRLLPERREPALAAATSDPAPIRFRWPMDGGSARVRPVEVLVDGYAPGRARVNIVRGGRYVVPMERACTLRVDVSGDAGRRVSFAVSDAATGDPIIRRTIPGTGVHEVTGLARGRVFVTAESVATGGAAAGVAVLSPETPALLSLSLASDSPDAPIRVILDVPEGHRPLEDFGVELEVELEAMESSATWSRRLDLDRLESTRVGDRVRYVIETDPMGIGHGHAWVDAFLVQSTFVHSPDRPALVELRVPDPVDFEVHVVDAATGRRTPHLTGDVGVVLDDHIMGSRDIEAVSPGRFVVTARGGTLFVAVPSAHGYIESGMRTSPRPGEIVVLEAEPIPSQLIGLCEAGGRGAPIDWPAGVEPVLTRGEDQPDATYRFEYEAGGVRLWVTSGSFWELHLPDMPGYRSGQTQTLWFGEDTELEMVRYGVER